MTEIKVELDENVLDRVASLICGDDTRYYRAGYEIQRLFENAGWKRVGEVDGGRRAWVVDKLRQRRHDSDALHAILLRLVDQREYLDDMEAWTQVMQDLNELLAVEGYQVVYAGGRPNLIAQEPTMKRP
ncbi:hypothetical protein ACFQ1S_35645, partial [Kibdelosporangium lantanae]